MRIAASVLVGLLTAMISGFLISAVLALFVGSSVIFGKIDLPYEGPMLLIIAVAAAGGSFIGWRVGRWVWTVMVPRAP